ncbi:MAG TPA: hopanoid biosynthesis-associated protein HpnK [Stellaceae bacterium]|nr:hopanoid biosynthesis-associated protein HpnK [Stellaceae bacterium]
MKKLIITADDFGLDEAVNEAIEAGHSRGVLTAASLMVTGAAAADAVARAKRLPRLGVGLHLVLIDGTPVLPSGEIPALVDGSGKFPKDAVATGIRIFCNGEARRQAAAEIRAQLDAFRRTGLPLDHVNAHHHFHLHPVVQRVLIELAPEFGIKAVRLPFEPRHAAARADGRRSWFAAGLLEAQFALLLRRRLDAAGIAHNDHIFGLADSGAMTGERVRRYLDVLSDGVSEIYLHPATRPVAAYPAHYLSRGEYEALIDPMVASALARRDIATLPFAGLSGNA